MSTMTDSDLKTRDSSSQDKDLEKHGAPTSVAVINASGHVSLMSFFFAQRLLWYVILTGDVGFLCR